MKSQSKHRTTSRRFHRRRGGGEQGQTIRVVYAPGYATALQSFIIQEPISVSDGIGAALTRLDDEFTNNIKTALEPEETDPKKPKRPPASTYILRILEKPEVAEVKLNRETKFCESEKKKAAAEQAKAVATN
jgi:hypothetical protein